MSAVDADSDSGCCSEVPVPVVGLKIILFVPLPCLVFMHASAPGSRANSIFSVLIQWLALVSSHSYLGRHQQPTNPVFGTRSV